MLFFGPPAARTPKSNFKSCRLTSSYGCTAEHVGVFAQIFNAVYIVSIRAAVRYKKQTFLFSVRGFKLHQSHIHYAELTPCYLCFDFFSHSVVISSTATTEDVSRSLLPDKKSFVHSAGDDVSAELDKKLMKLRFNYWPYLCAFEIKTTMEFCFHQLWKQTTECS